MRKFLALHMVIILFILLPACSLFKKENNPSPNDNISPVISVSKGQGRISFIGQIQEIRITGNASNISINRSKNKDIYVKSANLSKNSITMEKSGVLAMHLQEIKTTISIYLPEAYQKAVSVQTDTGKIQLEKMADLSQLRANTMGGDIVLRTSMAEKNEIETKTGNITIAVGNDISAAYSINTQTGKIDFRLKGEIRKRNSNTLEATVNKGKLKSEIKSEAGNISVK